MATIKIPGGTAEIRDPGTLTNREVKTITRHQRAGAAVSLKLKRLGFDEKDPNTWGVVSEMTEEDDDSIDEFQRLATIMRLESWTLDRNIPTSVEEVDELPRELYVPIVTACADISFDDDFSKENAADPKAITASSTGSRTRSKAAS